MLSASSSFVGNFKFTSTVFLGTTVVLATLVIDAVSEIKYTERLHDTTWL